MTLLPIICSFFAILTLLFGTYYYIEASKSSLKESDKQSKVIIVSLFLFALCSYLMAITLDKTNDLLANANSQTVDYTKVGAFGDLVGGLLNPVIAFFGIVAASLAFYVQYKANQQVQEQFNIQKFESQFYEMLRMHRENLNEMAISGYKFKYENDTDKPAILDSKNEKTTSGKKIFVTMLAEFEAIHLICKNMFHLYYKNKNNWNALISKEGEQLIFDHAYYIFFNGIGLYSKNIDKYIKDDTTGLLRKVLLEGYISELKDKRKKHDEKGIKKYPSYVTKTDFKLQKYKSETLWLSFNFRPFTGHQAILAHYYRHLFQTVKFIVKQDEGLLNYEAKRDYLRILRSTLSNYEQILLYYNWLAGFGSKWEEKKELFHLNKPYNKHNNRFFTDYRMIHNIPNQMILEEFSLKKIFDEKYRDFKYEKNRKDDDTLFELENIMSNLK